MRHPWWSPVRDLTRHVLVYSALLAVIFAATLFGSVLHSVAERVVVTKLPLHVLRFLEYAVVICDAIAVFVLMIRDLLRSLRRSLP